MVTGERLTGVVRDKSRFGAKVLPDGTTNPPFSRYFVHLDNRPTEEAVVDDNHITRDRKIFTKQVLRSFIKKTVTREAWTGAPWLVKKEVADKYHIDQRIPPHLRYESKAAERKQKQSQKQAPPTPDYEGMIGSFPGNGQARLPELKPAPKSHKSKTQQGQQAKTKQQPFLNPAPNYAHNSPYPPLPHMPRQHFQPTGQAPPPQQPHPGPTFATFHPGHNGHYTFTPMASVPAPPPPPPPQKYPIEDLNVMPRPDAPKRSQLKFFSGDIPVDPEPEKIGDDAKVEEPRVEESKVEEPKGEGNGILMKSVGPLLESWDTLSVYCEIFQLDSFTFDDFVEAMQFSSEDVECELFVEVHCAVLKILVSSEAEGGKVHVQLPEMEEEGDEEDEENDTSAIPTPTPEPEPQPVGRATRSSLAKAEAAALLAEAEVKPTREPSPEQKSFHRAAEMQLELNWIDRLRKRDFKNGGWQIIIIGLLHQLSKKTNSKKEPDVKMFNACEVLLKKLAPLDMEAVPETARVQYAKLDINQRVQALQILCMLTAQTRAVRQFMEECSEQMTTFRKEKIGFQRDRKIL